MSSNIIFLRNSWAFIFNIIHNICFTTKDERLTIFGFMNSNHCS